jgi:DNA repair exonuclease SbcCD ATPase subunit
MRELTLKTLIVEGFKSFRTRTEIQFPAGPGLRFLGGDNQVEPRLGANGAGKSALIESIIWCCYGTDALGRRTSDVLSWGASKCAVTCIFSVGATPYEIMVSRSGPPNRMWLDEMPAEQAEIDDALGLTKTRFQQAVLFGQKAPMFLDLPIPQRGELLDDVLNLGLWLKLSEYTSRQIEQSESDRHILKYEQSRLDGQLEKLSDDAALQATLESWKINHEREIETSLLCLEEAERDAASTNEQLSEAKRQFDSAEKPGRLSARLREEQDRLIVLQQSAKSIQSRIVSLSEAITFYTENEECPTCGQPLSTDFAAEHVEQHEKLLSDKQAEAEKNADFILHTKENILALETDLRTANERERSLYGLIIRLESQLKSAQRQVEVSIAQAEKLATQINPYQDLLEKQRAEREQAKKERAAVARKIFSLDGKIASYNYWKSGFKKVRLFLVRRILSTLEVEVGSAASALGLPGWHIGFATETENKSGTTKTGIQIEVKAPHIGGKWAAPSPGEDQRVRISIAIGLANLIQRMSGVFYSFEMWDEPTSGLSVEGVADLLQCLKYRADSTKKAIWIIDHRSQDFAFDEAWTVRKAENGSVVEKEID